jgi:hypothetical protein
MLIRRVCATLNPQAQRRAKPAVHLLTLGVQIPMGAPATAAIMESYGSCSSLQRLRDLCLQHCVQASAELNRMIASTNVAMALKRKSRSRTKAINIRRTRSTGKMIMSAIPAVTIRVHIIADEAPGPPVISRANPNAMTVDPSQVPRCSTLAKSWSSAGRCPSSALTPYDLTGESRGQTAASAQPGQRARPRRTGAACRQTQPSEGARRALRPRQSRARQVRRLPD